jgi:hypothetical protein
MKGTDYIQFLKRSIRDQRMTLKFHISLAFIFVLLGLILIIVALGKIIPESQKLLATFTGIFISSVSAFPIKQISDRRTKISALEFLLDRFKKLENNESDLANEESNILGDRFWKLTDTYGGR